MADRADMGAVGKGSLSLSEVRRKRTYPEVNQETRPTMVPATRRAMGQIQSGCRKVRSANAGESGPGDHQNGSSLATPNCAASAERTKYWRHRRSRKAPSSRATRAEATYTRRKISCRLSEVKERLATSRKRITVTHCAADPMEPPVTNPRYISPGVMIREMKITPMTVRRVNPLSKRLGASRSDRYSSTSSHCLSLSLLINSFYGVVAAEILCWCDAALFGLSVGQHALCGSHVVGAHVPVHGVPE